MKSNDRKNSFTIHDSMAMYGVVIMMLVFHHLMCDPSRLHHPFINLFPEWVLTVFAVFCHISVAVYAYITGYGFQKKFMGKAARGGDFLKGCYRIIK